MVTEPAEAQFIPPTVIPNVTPEPIITKDASAVKGIVQVRSHRLGQQGESWVLHPLCVELPRGLSDLATNLTLCLLSVHAAGIRRVHLRYLR